MWEWCRFSVLTATTPEPPRNSKGQLLVDLVIRRHDCNDLGRILASSLIIYMASFEGATRRHP